MGPRGFYFSFHGNVHFITQGLGGLSHFWAGVTNQDCWQNYWPRVACPGVCLLNPFIKVYPPSQQQHQAIWVRGGYTPRRSSSTISGRGGYTPPGRSSPTANPERRIPLHQHWNISTSPNSRRSSGGNCLEGGYTPPPQQWRFGPGEVYPPTPQHQDRGGIPPPDTLRDMSL